MDGHALVPVDLLDLFHQVLLGLANTLDLQQFLGVPGALNDGIACLHLVTVGDLQTGNPGDRVDLLGSVVGNHGDLTTTALVLADPDHTRNAGQGGLALRGARLEQLHDPR